MHNTRHVKINMIRKIDGKINVVRCSLRFLGSKLFSGGKSQKKERCMSSVVAEVGFSFLWEAPKQLPKRQD